MKKRKLLAFLIAGTCALTCATVGAWALDAEKVNAAYTNEGGVDHYTDMTSNGVDLEYYDTLYNEDWKRNGGAALTETWDMTDDYYITFTPSESNKTGSFVWKFTYTCTNTAAVNIYPLCSGAWPSNGNSTVFNFHDCGFETGKTYEVELGVVKVKNSTNYFVFVKADGVFKMGTYRDESLKQGNGLYFYLAGGDGVLVSEKPEVVYECEDYAVVQNDDLGLAGSYTAPSGDATNGVGFTNELTTASYVYKFNYTPADSNDAIVYMRSDYWGGGSKLNCYFRGTQIIYQINGVDNVVSDLFTMGETSVVELGAIDIKDSENTWIFVKVDGETVLSQVVDATVAAQTKGMSFFGGSASTFGQYSYDVSFNGETQEVLANQAIGTLPETPANDNEFLGWFDQDGNKVTAETVVTKDMTVTSAFAEPHNVTFTVDGETYATYENVAYNSAIGTLPEAPKKAGYDFVKWTCGGVEVTPESIVSSHMTVVAEYAERGYYIDEELEDYVVVQNDDLGLVGSYTVPSGDATNGVGFTNELTTASYVYKFNYTPADSNDAIVYMRSAYWGGASKLNCFFRGAQIIYQINGVDNVVSDLFAMDETSVVELGAIDIKDSENTWIFVKVNGETVLSQVVDATVAAQTKGMSFFGTSQSVFTQYAWTVDFNGETREVVNGAAIGELPSAPESNYEFIGWVDLYGNILTAETVITENLTAMPIFNEPHTVTFVVNGETLTTLENVGYQETVTPPECSVPGYDFVKWVYGDNVEFTAETQVVSNLTVMAVLAARDFTADELADYIVVTNKDIGAAASITNTNSMYGNYSYVTDNATTSVVYKFVYIRGEKPLYLAVRDVKDGWGANADKDATTVSGYQFILNGTYLESPLCDSIVAFPTENGAYLVEIGAIDVKNSSEVWVYVKVNGETVVDIRAAAPVGVGNYIGMWGDDASTSTFNEANDYHFLEGVVEKHTAVEVEALAATCTEEGHTAYSYCENCKAVLLEKEIIDALGHEEETVEGYSATCTETGLTDGVVCTVCEEVLTEQTEIAALGHDLQAVEAVAPDCETVGATAGEKCVREGCGMIVSGCEEIAAKGHTAVTDEAVASTCIERGKTEGSHCGDCGKILQEQESLPLAEHNYVDGVCSVCGDEDVSAVVPEDSSNDSSAEENNGSSASSGCFGSVGSAFGGIVMAIGATAIFLKKKKEEK